jgi:hypothetical protein
MTSSQILGFSDTFKILLFFSVGVTKIYVKHFLGRQPPRKFNNP